MGKRMEIKCISYVMKNGEKVRFDDLTPEEKLFVATELKIAYLNELFRGRAIFYRTSEAEKYKGKEFLL